MDIGREFNGSDVRILMAVAVCYALIALHDDEELQEQVNSVLFNEQNDILAKQFYIQSIMYDVNEALIKEYINGGN